MAEEDSERSNECIDFTMLESVEILLQFPTMGVVSDSKMNLVGELGVFKGEKPKKKIKEKREFSRKTSFRPNWFFYMVITEIFCR
ncbi:hypothetical protein FWK35_00001759 [Aphis craccivora]|uniref:Uncharacterized protein n=1 Tax=Aphis craccivora TaxID=307492 RepID=A0A6G0ZP39_APHCR|nr:hypothetical protein FWK35_00001759 [Aphis craccivora]